MFILATALLRVVAGFSAALLIFALLLTGIARRRITRSSAIALVLAAAICLPCAISFPLLLGAAVGGWLALRFADLAI